MTERNEQKVDPKEKLQISLCDSHDVSTNHTVELPRSKLTVQKLTDIAKKEMTLSWNSSKMRIFRENGAELTSSNLYRIRNRDALYVSDGAVLADPYDTIHLCVMGPGAVGKSAITLQFIKGRFIGNYDPTIEDQYRKHLDVDGNTVDLDILDTAGQEDFKCLQTQWMKDKDGFILVFSIIQKASFHGLEELNEKLSEVYDEEDMPPIIIVGNKIDLDPNHIAYIPPERQGPSDDDEADDIGPPERQVSYDEAVAFARQIGAAHYVETSAKSGHNVENMFGKMARHLINIKYRDQQNAAQMEENGPNAGGKSGGDNGGGRGGNSNAKWWTKCQIL